MAGVPLWLSPLLAVWLVGSVVAAGLYARLVLFWLLHVERRQRRGTWDFR